ncbi:MAG: hypothetical protein IPM29_29505 [Planctomycetes bacterium]|nr:hypothetical protein [Planctomycetota bacterium]
MFRMSVASCAIPRLVSSLVALAALLAVPTAPRAQSTDAAVTIRRGCTHPAPAGSLVPVVTTPTVWRADANDFVAFEIESTPAVNGWALQSDRAGFSGQGYYRWIGPNYFSSPGNGILTYRVWIDDPGTYQVRIHNRHDHPDPSEENDCWLSVNGSSWIKCYSNLVGISGRWNWHFRFDPGHGIVQYPMNRGVNEIRVSGRSNGFMIDRVHVYRQPFQGENLALPLSARERSRPIVGQRFELLAGDPNGETPLQPQGSFAQLMLALRGSGSCGTPIFGLGPAGGPGEYLLDPAARAFPFTPPTAWANSGRAARLALDIPNDANLVGVRLFGQGVLYDGAPRIVLTDGLVLELGDR